MITLNHFLELAWKRYARLTPDADKVQSLLKERGETVVNDHVAFRTFNLPGIDRLHLGKIFEKWGYKPVEDLDFPEKKLTATYYVHPEPNLPKFFISELLVEKFPPELQEWIRQVSAPALSEKRAKDRENAEFFLEDSWGPIQLGDYQKYYQTSEYAAWTAAFGIQVNHFTVLVNSLKSFKTLQELNDFVQKNGFELNAAGGVVKGNPQELLEQSSTMAKRIPWNFSGGVKKDIMGCYYEFARRYPIPGTEKLFQGFIPKSANKIFESTFEKKLNT